MSGVLQTSIRLLLVLKVCMGGSVCSYLLYREYIYCGITECCLSKPICREGIEVVRDIGREHAAV